MIKKYLAVVLAAVLLLSGCGDGLLVEKEAKRPASTGESWTVMIYMSASTLEEENNRAGEVLNSLPYDLPENINVIVETGGCREWNTDGMKNDRITDFKVQKNGIRTINEGLLKNMGDSNTYKEFLVRTMEQYPADHYISVIWGESSGVLGGTAHDSTYEFDSLTPEEIAQALSDIGQNLDIIGFDSGLMANFETACTLSLYADYMVASEDIMPMSGWDYGKLFGYISENPSASAAQVGQVICDGAKELADGEKDPIAMSVTDLSQMTNLLQSFDTMSRYMSAMSMDTEALRRLILELNTVKSMGADSTWEGYSNLVDIGSFAKAVFNAGKDDSARLENIISKTVVYKTADKMYGEISGMNMYYPKNKRVAEINGYKAICPSDSYVEFIDRINTNDLVENRVADYTQSPVWQYYNAVAPQNVMSVQSDLNGYFILSVTNPEIVASAYVNLYKYDEDAGKYVYLGTDRNTSYSVDANGYIYELPDVCMELNGFPVSAYLINATEGYEIYSIPILHDEKISSLRVKKTFKEDKNEYSVIGLWEGKDALTSVVKRGFKTLGAGDVVIPIYTPYGGGDGEYIKGKRIKIVFGGLNITEKTVRDGDYIITYTAKDIYGLESESEAMAVTALNGKLKFSK